jgi:hypothetical protein
LKQQILFKQLPSPTQTTNDASIQC